MLKPTNNLLIFLLFVLLSVQGTFPVFYRILFILGSVGAAADTVLSWWYFRHKKVLCVGCGDQVESNGDHFQKSCSVCKEHYWTCDDTDNLSEPNRAKDHEEVTCSICKEKYKKCAKTEAGESVGTALHGEGKCVG